MIASGLSTVEEIQDALVSSLRSYIGEPLASAHVRRGPQHGFRLPTGTEAVVLVRLRGLGGGERLGIGNRSHAVWAFYIVGLVPLSADSAYTKHLQLVQAIWDWHSSDRDVGATVLRAELHDLECATGSYLSEDDQEFHVVEATTLVQVVRTSE